MNMAQSTIVFDTHEAVQELTTAGVPERQAEAHVRLQARLIEQNFATKDDIESLRLATKADTDSLRQEMRAEFAKVRTEMADLRAELKGEIADLRAELKGEIADLRAKLKGEIADLRAELKGDIANVRTEMADLRTSLTDKIDTSFRWLIGLQVGIAGILLAAIKLF